MGCIYETCCNKIKEGNSCRHCVRDAEETLVVAPSPLMYSVTSLKRLTGPSLMSNWAETDCSDPGL